MESPFFRPGTAYEFSFDSNSIFDVVNGFVQFDKHSLGPTGFVFGGHILFSMAGIYIQDSCDELLETGFDLSCKFLRPVEVDVPYEFCGSPDANYLLHHKNYHCCLQGSFVQQDKKLSCVSKRDRCCFHTAAIDYRSGAESSVKFDKSFDPYDALYSCLCFLDYQSWAVASFENPKLNMVTGAIKVSFVPNLNLQGNYLYLVITQVNIVDFKMILTAELLLDHRLIANSEITLVNVHPETREKIMI